MLRVVSCHGGRYGYLDRAVVLRRRSCGADVYELTNETVMIKSTNTKRFYREVRRHWLVVLGGRQLSASAAAGAAAGGI